MAIQVRVRNFQSIEDALIVIDGLTVITGTNNAGKSAFFRAIRGVFTNARGSDFVRHGAKHCTVDITFPDKRTLTWKKGSDGTNDYVIDGKHYPKVGVGAPPEVREFGVAPVPVGNTELWPQVAQQVTGVSFLLHETGSVMAEAVADVERVNQLSGALKLCESDRRSTRSSLKVRREDLKTHQTRREIFDGLDQAVERLRGLEDRHAKARKVAKATAALVRLGERHRTAREAVHALEGLDAVDSTLPSSERLRQAQKLSEGLAETIRLRKRRRTIRETVEALEGLDDAARALPSDARMDYAEQFRKALGLTVDIAMRWEESDRELRSAQAAEEALAGIVMDDTLLDRAAKFRKARSNAEGLKTRYVRARDAVADLAREVGDQEASLAQLDGKLTTVLGTLEECPTCGGDLDHVH